MRARSFTPATGHRFAGSARRVGVAATVVAVGLGGVIAAAPPSVALPPAGPTVTVLNNLSNPASNVAVGATLAVTAAAPITVPGATAQTITQTWNTAQASITPSSIVTPEGWTTTYTTDGTTYSSTLPSPSTSISGVQSTGAVFSDGTSSGLQVSTATGTGTLKTAPVFAPSSGGDGWDAFTSGAFVMNAWHHNSAAYNLDCHLVSTGTACGPVYSVSGYETSKASSGTVDSGKVYSVVGENASSSIGVLCTNVSALPFTSCGYTMLVAGTADYNLIGSAQESGTKIYAPLSTGSVVCFDISTLAACAGQPYALSSFGTSGSSIPAFATAVGPDVFITASKIWCLTGSTGAACAGSWPAGSYSTSVLTGAVPMRNTSGTLTGVCMIAPAGTCFTLAGASATPPTGFAALLASNGPDAAVGVGGWGQFGFGATKQYWFAGAWGNPNTPVCYDWTTDAACAGFQTTTAIGVIRYTIRVDTTNPNCLWSNGDNGSVAPFDANTGQPGCQGSDPVVDIPYTAVVPRLSCTEAGRIRNWQNITFTPPGAIAVSALRVTVLDSSGVAIAGYTALTPNGSGVVDLSALAVATSGTQPTFEVTAIGASSPNASAISAAVTYTSDAPQLCFTLTTIHNCPTLAPGLSLAATVAVSDVALGGSTVATASGVPTTTPLSAAITRANMAGCVGTVSGTATQTYSSGAPDAPLAYGTVNLLDSLGTVVASTMTASDGTYSFANANPAAYTAQMSQVTHALSVSAGGTTVQNFSVPYVAPTVAPAPMFTQLGGADRDTTAAMVATTMYPLVGSASVVVLARDDLYADGLTGSPLANALGGPLLLSPTASLSAATQGAVGHVLVPGGLVIVLGGTSAISPSVVTTLQKLGYQVERIGGADRFATATLIADKIGTKHAVTHVYVATGFNFADALSAADAAGLNNGVVLLTANGTMPGSTSTWLAAHAGAAATAIGGQAAAADPTATALVGSDRYATAALVANSVAPNTVGIVLATGANFPDGLAGAVYAAHNGWSLLLVDPTAVALNTDQMSYLHEVSATVSTVTAIGGTATMPVAATTLITAGLT
ncbi:MAG TPA: cell wall-binding repeat-containing protein [Acidothermaceae bacterium]